jgi:formate C-acetyltransferase
MRFEFPPNHDPAPMLALRRAILDSPVDVGLARAEAFTRVWQANEGAPWIVKKALALREYFRTVPLYIRPYDLLAGTISEAPGAMPVMVELGIAEENIYVNEQPQRLGYLAGKVPQPIIDYWEERNLWGHYRAYMRTVHGTQLERTDAAMYKFLSNQGHLSPSYCELLEVGLDGILARIRARRAGEIDPASLEFLAAAEYALLGLQEWIERHVAFLAEEAERCADAGRARQLSELARIAGRVAHEPPTTFHEAMQLVWFAHQAIHIEGHGYSCTPDRLDQILYPYYRADRDAGRLDDDFALTLCENFLLKQRDNTFWGIEHNLTQGLVVGGSTADGTDQTNELSWLFIKATGEMSLPEPLVWVRWHPNIDPDFFDFCLQNLAGSTCFPLMMSDTAVPAMFMALGATREDAFDYVPVGCNELGIPGKAYFNPGAHVDYLRALELALTGGRGYDGCSEIPGIPPASELRTFGDLTASVGRVMRWQVQTSYAANQATLMAQMRWGQTPLTSCFFDGCIERGRDLAERTKYNILSCGGSFFANMVDSLAAIREVVFERGDATLEQIAAACKTNFEGQELLRQRLLRAPKHGNDDARVEDLVALVERLRDEPVKELCRDPRDGTPFGNVHITRSSAVRVGARTPATPDGRLAGTPLAASVAASCGVERQGPTAVLKSILQLNAAKSWQCGYNVNLRFQRVVLADPDGRKRLDAMLRAYFMAGGQEMQINSADTAELRDAQAHPERYRDLVVRVAGFSAFFVSLTKDMQDEIIARTEHA